MGSGRAPCEGTGAPAAPWLGLRRTGRLRISRICQSTSLSLAAPSMGAVLTPLSAALRYRSIFQQSEGSWRGSSLNQHVALELRFIHCSLCTSKKTGEKSPALCLLVTGFLSKVLAEEENSAPRVIPRPLLCLRAPLADVCCVNAPH